MGESPSGRERSESVQKTSSKEFVRNRRLIIGFPPVDSATSAFPYTLRLMGSPVKRKSGEKGSVAFLKESNNWVACPKMQSHRRNLFYGRAEIRIKLHREVLQGRVTPLKNIVK